jgi:hypothetical protein
MIIGTLFTLFVVPSIYVLVARTHAVAAAEEPVDDGLVIPQPVNAV